MEDEHFELFEAALSSLDIHNTDSGWYLDSGATQHVSGDRSHFTSLDQFSGNVKIADGQSHQISGKGSVHFTLPSGEIKDINGVLYVPGLRKNLLSIGSLTDKGIIACFDDQKCILFSKGNKRIVAEGLQNKRNGLYQLSTVNLDIMANIAQVEINNARLWHHRLGHIGYDKLHDLTAKRMATGIPYIPTYIEVCNECQASKQNREGFSQRTATRASIPLELIHLDLCGSFPIPSLGGSQYFMVIVDNYSRFIWIRFL